MTQNYVMYDVLIKTGYISLAAAAFLFVSTILLSGLHP